MTLGSISLAGFVILAIIFCFAGLKSWVEENASSTRTQKVRSKTRSSSHPAKTPHLSSHVPETVDPATLSFPTNAHLD